MLERLAIEFAFDWRRCEADNAANGLSWSERAIPFDTRWTSLEVVYFETAMQVTFKNWPAILEKLGGGKTLRQVIAFYYYWHASHRYLDSKSLSRITLRADFGGILTVGHEVVLKQSDEERNPRLRQRPRVEYSLTTKRVRKASRKAEEAAADNAANPSRPGSPLR